MPLTIVHFFLIPLMLKDSYKLCDNIHSDLNFQDKNNIFVFKLNSPEEISTFTNITSVNLDSNIYVYYPVNDREYRVLELYKLHKEMPLVKNYFGNWNTDDKAFKELNKLNKWERRSDMSGLNLRYAVATQEPFIMYQTGLETG